MKKPCASSAPTKVSEYITPVPVVPFAGTASGEAIPASSIEEEKGADGVAASTEPLVSAGSWSGVARLEISTSFRVSPPSSSIAASR